MMNQRTGSYLPVVLLLVFSFVVAVPAVAQDRPSERVSPPPQCNPDAVVWRTPEPPENPQKGDIWVNPKDGMEMVYIAAGESVMGTSDNEVERWLADHPETEDWQSNSFVAEQPQLRVSLAGYWMSRTEVTNAQYLRFVNATRHGAPAYWKDGQVPAGLEDYPVVAVSWDDARAYCEWTKGQLPTEAEWEKAARGGDDRTYPWGFHWDRHRCRNLGLVVGRILADGADWSSAMIEWMKAHDPIRDGLAEVGSCVGDTSSYGCFDMAGNAWEWCAEWYDAGAYERYARNALGPPQIGEDRVLRGGAWGWGLPWSFRCASRCGYDANAGWDHLMNLLN